MRGIVALALLAASAASAQELADERVASAYAAYGRAAAITLAARGEPRDALVAVLIDGYAAKHGDVGAPARRERVWVDAYARAPDDVLFHWIAATGCPTGEAACERRDRRAALAALSRLEPDNGAVWQLVLGDALARDDAVLARDALARLARAERYDTHQDELFAALDTALATVPIPQEALALGEEQLDEPTARGVAVLGVLLALALPDPGWLTRYCTPGVVTAFESRRDDCVAAGERMATRSETSLGRFVGARVWREAARGSPHEPRARRALVAQHWRVERYGPLAAAAGADALRTQLERRRNHGSEAAAIDAALAAAGIPLEPPPDYVPRGRVD